MVLSRSPLPAAEVRTSVDVQYLAGHLGGLREIEHRFGDVLGRSDLTESDLRIMAMERAFD